MILTKQQQEKLVEKYVAEKHNTDDFTLRRVFVNET